MSHDLEWLVSVALTALIAGFFFYIGWDAARTLIPIVLGLLDFR